MDEDEEMYMNHLADKLNTGMKIATMKADDTDSFTSDDDEWENSDDENKQEINDVSRTKPSNTFTLPQQMPTPVNNSAIGKNPGFPQPNNFPSRFQNFNNRLPNPNNKPVPRFSNANTAPRFSNANTAPRLPKFNTPLPGLPKANKPVPRLSNPNNPVPRLANSNQSTSRFSNFSNSASRFSNPASSTQPRVQPPFLQRPQLNTKPSLSSANTLNQTRPALSMPRTQVNANRFPGTSAPFQNRPFYRPRNVAPDSSSIAPVRMTNKPVPRVSTPGSHPRFIGPRGIAPAPVQIESTNIEDQNEDYEEYEGSSDSPVKLKNEDDLPIDQYDYEVIDDIPLENKFPNVGAIKLPNSSFTTSNSVNIPPYPSTFSNRNNGPNLPNSSNIHQVPNSSGTNPMPPPILAERPRPVRPGTQPRQVAPYSVQSRPLGQSPKNDNIPRSFLHQNRPPGQLQTQIKGPGFRPQPPNPQTSSSRFQSPTPRFKPQPPNSQSYPSRFQPQSVRNRTPPPLTHTPSPPPPIHTPPPPIHTTPIHTPPPQIQPPQFPPQPPPVRMTNLPAQFLTAPNSTDMNYSDISPHCNDQKTLELDDGTIINNLVIYCQIRENEYFHAIGNSRVSLLLKEENMFLFRPSRANTDDNPLTLCLKYGGLVYKYAVNRRENGLYSIGELKQSEQQFRSIQEMVDFFSKNKFSFEGKATYFGKPAYKTTQ